MFNIRKYEQLIQGNKTNHNANTACPSLRLVIFLALVALAVSQLFCMFKVFIFVCQMTGNRPVVNSKKT